jgi:hypothetical protein
MVNDTEFGINHQPAIEAYRRDVGAPIKSPASIPFARDDGVSLLHMAFKGATFPRYWWNLANIELLAFSRSRWRRCPNTRVTVYESTLATTWQRLMDKVGKLISDLPQFHSWSRERIMIGRDVLRFLRDNLRPSMHTLETGAGYTTVVFAIAETQHVCITPYKEETEAIRNYCREHDIKNTITFIHESSDIALPLGTSIPEELDFVFIDGAHRFPFSILDWHFTEKKIPVGGFIGIDDCYMPSVRILSDFLLEEAEWELVRRFRDTSFFRRRTKTPESVDWYNQRMNKWFFTRGKVRDAVRPFLPKRLLKFRRSLIGE